MNPRKRFENALSGGPLDRIPVALWRHFPVDDQSAGTLAAAALAFQRMYQFDLVKLTFASSYMAVDWGLQDAWRGAAEGTRAYVSRPVAHPEDWLALPALNPKANSLGDQLDALRRTRTALGPDVPLLATVFSPLDTARKLVGENTLRAHMRQHPDALHEGLRMITETTLRFIEAAMETGIDGLFYAIQHAQYPLFTLAEHQTFGRAYDLQTLAPASQLWLNMLHLHGVDVMFDAVADYPVQILNWHDRETSPNLAEGIKRFGGMVCGGLRRLETMELGTPSQVSVEAQNAIAQAGSRLLLGTGCVLTITTPHGNIMAVRRAVEPGFQEGL